MRRALSFAVVALLAIGTVAVGGAEPTQVPPAAEAAVTPTTQVRTTNQPGLPTTTTTTAPPPPAVEDQPVAPPADQRAYEPMVVIGRIVIPKLGLDVPLNQGISLRTIDRGPSHWPGTALPGQQGNVVIAGHRVTNTRPFRHIHTLAPGDEIRFEVGGAWTTYRVRAHEVVTPDAMRIVEPTPTPTATLFACHPPGSARYRYVVYADLVTS
jgi:sortase A